MARVGLVAVVGALGLLLLPGSATAGAPVRNLGWIPASGGYQTVFDVSSQIRVFYINTPLPVTNPTVSQGGPATCQAGQPDGNPNQFECFFGAGGGTPGSRVVTSWQGSGIDPSAHFQFFLSRTGQLPYEGPSDVPPVQVSSMRPRTDLSRFTLRLDAREHRPTGFEGHFWHYTMEGLLPDVGYDEDLFFPRGFSYAGADIPKCSLPRLMRGDKCQNAIIGTARITAYPHDCLDSLTFQNATPTVASLTLFNFGRKEIYALRKVPGAITGFEINVNKNHLSIDLPDSLISPSPNLCTPATDIRFTAPIARLAVRKGVTGAARRKKPVGPFVTGGCPKSRIWRFKDTLKFTNGARNPSTGNLARNTVATVTRTASGTCRK